LSISDGFVGPLSRFPKADENEFALHGKLNLSQKFNKHACSIYSPNKQKHLAVVEMIQCILYMMI
jgi:hypothetical protein